MNQPIELTQSLKTEAKRLGFDLVGVCRALPSAQFDSLQTWLNSGFAGEMQYLEERKEAYRDPSSVLAGVRSLIVLGTNYATQRPREPGNGQGRVSRYAWNDSDYHDVIHRRLKALKRFLLSQRPACSARGVIDTAPLLEREFAQLAGLGWQAKNTMLINRKIGSWFFLSVLLTDETLEYDQPFSVDHCGTCTACLDACPTDAFVAPRVLDATRCISYLTIEHRSEIPRELRTPIGDWIFGCDVCQDVCPWNRKATASADPTFQPSDDRNPIDLVELFEMDDDAFRTRFRKTPLWRSRRRGILRNAAIVLGNRPVPEGRNALERGLSDDESLVRGACAWALANYSEIEAHRALESRRRIETDESVLEEINAAVRIWKSSFAET